MLINLRNALMAGRRLPYDAEIEFLESTGTQWIDTGVIATENTRVKATLMTLSTNNKNWFGGQVTGLGSNANGFCFNAYASSRVELVFGGSGWVVPAVSDIVNRIFTLDFSKDGVVIDGITVATPSYTTFAQQTAPIAIFVRVGGSAYVNGRLYAFQIYQNGILVRDYIPVRKGTVGYLYDRVSGKLFGNAGTGDFVLGPDVVPVEWLESHGTEWIDTGFNITNATSFSYDAKFSLASTIANSEPRLFSNEGAGSGAYYDIYFATSANILSIRQSGTTAQISRRDVPIVSTMDEQGNYRGYYEDEPQSLLYNATRAFVAPTTDRDYRIFSRGNNTSSQFLWQGKLYWLNFTKNGEPSRRYRPVRVGTEGAMIDTLTRRIYRNAGTGAFTYGNDLKYPIPAS